MINWTSTCFSMATLCASLPSRVFHIYGNLCLPGYTVGAAGSRYNGFLKQREGVMNMYYVFCYSLEQVFLCSRGRGCALFQDVTRELPWMEMVNSCMMTKKFSRKGKKLMTIQLRTCPLSYSSGIHWTSSHGHYVIYCCQVCGYRRG